MILDSSQGTSGVTAVDRPASQGFLETLLTFLHKGAGFLPPLLVRRPVSWYFLHAPHDAPGDLGEPSE